MMAAFLCLIGCELVGELIRDAIGLPVPGTVVGMFLLATILVVRAGTSGAAIPPALERTAQTLIDLMGLLFVPAGVGIIAEIGLLRTEWLPILVALVCSTVLSIVVTGLVMHWTMQWDRPGRPNLQTGLKGVPHE